MQSKSTDNLAVNCPSNTIHIGVALCLQSNSTLKCVANHSTEETICASGWLPSYRYLPCSTGRISFKTVVRDLLMCLFCDCYQNSQVPGMSTIECSRVIAICANKVQPRSAWQNSQNGRPPFWFYRESIRISDGECM